PAHDDPARPVAGCICKIIRGPDDDPARDPHASPIGTVALGSDLPSLKPHDAQSSRTVRKCGREVRAEAAAFGYSVAWPPRDPIPHSVDPLHPKPRRPTPYAEHAAGIIGNEATAAP